MKYILTLITLFFVSQFSQAQDFQKYTDSKDVDEVVITQNAFDLLSEVDLDSDDQDMRDLNELVKTLKEIRVISTKKKEIAAKIEADIKTHESSSDINELMRVKEDGNHIIFYAKPGETKGKVSRLLMRMNKKDMAVFLSIKGDIDLNKIAKLAKIFHFPGAKELKNINSN